MMAEQPHLIAGVTGVAKWLFKAPRPDADKSGSYGIFDNHGQPAGVYKDYDEAVTDLREIHKMGGTVYDLGTLENITPEPRFRQRLGHFFNSKPIVRLPKFGAGAGDSIGAGGAGDPAGSTTIPGRMDDSTQQAVKSMASMGGTVVSRALLPDLSVIAKYVEQLNRMALPAIDNFNYANPDLTREVVVEEPEVEIRHRTEVRTVDQPQTITTVTREPVPYPTDDAETRPISGFEEILDVDPSTLALPPEAWAPDVLDRAIPVPQYFSTTSSTDTVMVPTPTPVDVPYEATVIKKRTMHEPDDSKGQLLAVLQDWSPSVHSENTEDCDSRRLAIGLALTSTVVGCHLHDGSRYYYRAFTEYVGPVFRAETETQKLQLIASLRQPPGIGGGTNIARALTVTAEDIRQRRFGPEVTPEILLITDGQGAEDYYAIRSILGDDVILHTVCLLCSNYTLRTCSDTYVELWLNGDQLVARNVKDSHRSFRR